MGQKKKYLTKSINLGLQGEPARMLAEKYIKDNGKSAFSAFVRKLIYVSLSGKKEFEGINNQWERDRLIKERKELAEQINHISERKSKIDSELKKLGVDALDIEF